MKKGLKKALIIIPVVLFSLVIIGYIVYDYVLMVPSITIAYEKNIGQQKLDTEFKVQVEIESLSVLEREYIVNLELKSGTEVKASLQPQIFRLKPRTKQNVEFVCMLSEPVIPGLYTANVFVTAKKSIFSSSLEMINENGQEFAIAEKIVNGIINFIDIKGAKKVGEILNVNAVAKNTGEVGKPFSVDGSIINPKGESAQLPTKDFSLKIEESKIFSYDYNIPFEAPAGKYKIILNLFAGESKDNSKKKLAEQEQEVEVSARVIKASVEAVKVRGKLKSGEAVGFDIDLKNTGDIEKLFSIEASLTDASGKVVSLPGKELQIKVDETKKAAYEYLIPMKDSDGKYKINIIVYAGSANDLTKMKMAESQQEFTVAERITKASIVKVSVSSKNKIKVGETITITADLKNTGETDHTFPVAVVAVNAGKATVKLNAKIIPLKVGEAGQLTFDYAIPLESTAGNYEVKVSTYNNMDNLGNLIEMYEEKVSVFAVAGANISGSASLVGTLGKFGFGDSVSIKTKFSNSGELRHSYFIKLEVIDPAKKVSTIFNEKIELDKLGVSEKKGEFKVDPSVLDGKYTAVVSIWDRLGDDGNPTGKYGEDTQTFEVVDTEPVITNVIGVAPVIGKATTIVATVKDDKEVKTVMLVYQGPGMSEVGKEIMIRTSGNKKEGSYNTQTRRFNYAGSLNYYIEATDSKGQKSKSPESKTQIK
ncbi:MAG: hypothetical protein A2452_01095 [Candidatus Firestonebacteria bacterium RIFOXYC2_FULL_39_67]|nr:MAG: hypothetical protein A2536_11160 [Candidatus Firestonebacteria bacterium RIFOXYD2_FULL_39_29]OGF54074.1 MAG: hypothetical protein A2452_01095 [Candidatus Firestonebacteria bacterium RIFOXYC2_FULL_39_67]